ncbi:hypothetical protein Csa_004454 [Cucumis sativus]|uniref:Cystatin domain-containing protein n=1 Tax=Cucumis sativus TaxID=3659 RepID=A0A0A0KIX9_CUCSA|nr:hypothetical protein Csa_004454 [Cucumis sativus]
MSRRFPVSKQILPVDPSDRSLIEQCVPLVINHCQSIHQIDVKFEGILHGQCEVGPNGKTYTLRLKLKDKVGDRYVLKIGVIKFFCPLFGPPSLLSFECSKEINV